MATISVILDTRNKKAKKFPIVIRLSHKGIPKMIPLGYKTSFEDWNNEKQRVKKSYPNSTRVNAQITSKFSAAESLIAMYDFNLKDMSVYQLAEIIKKEINETSTRNFPINEIRRTTLKEYGKKVAKVYREAKRFGMAKGMESAINVFTRYAGDVYLKDIDETMLMAYEAHCKGRGVKINGYGVQLRYIRRIYNLAIKDKSVEVTRNDYPFGPTGYSIQNARTQKRAIPIEYIRQIAKLPYEEGTTKWHTRNYILFSFFCRGMNFVDIAFLTRDKIVDGRLMYMRTKTKSRKNTKTLNVKLPKEALEILSYYLKEERPGNLVFPILEKFIHLEASLVYEIYNNRRATFNKRLNRIGEDVKLPLKLTSYVIRHTFATGSLKSGISTNVIGDMLGHTDYVSTEAYLADLENEVLDKAADSVFSLIPSE
ncbi:site-specific integrase [Fulvivirga ulvae]|uniref:tyrosine-type recombinase/integrase n=1 Tax=Fulvivirga ulvae TaxID=2904245 RepID=UPI001F21C138|nr:tyrosine-type recombinase/integrase [Fulvivirga ulvae]UII32148.1 site-specific integrase [Fulvivirga ulvae]